jgi:hypothetical protein
VTCANATRRFSQGWQLAFVLLGVFPLLAGAAGWMARNLSAAQNKSQEAYKGAGSIAEQAVSGIRTGIYARECELVCVCVCVCVCVI